MNTRRLLRLSIGASTVTFVLLLLAVALVTPAFAQEPEPIGSIEVIPHPPRLHEPTEVRLTLYNEASTDILRYAQFSWSEFGIGMVRHPIGARRPFTVPATSWGGTHVTWFPRQPGPYCLYVDIFDELDGLVAHFQHNIQVQPYPPVGGVEVMPIGIRNPFTYSNNITVGLTLPNGWVATLEPQVFESAPPGDLLTATLVITHADRAPTPPDGVTFRVDGFADNIWIGYVAKKLGPPLLLHWRPEPPYAESEISVRPYPLRLKRPAAIGVAVRNPTNEPQSAELVVEVAPFGINLPSSVVASIPITVAPHSTLQKVVPWVPPAVWQRDLVCIRARLIFDPDLFPGLEVMSQRNVDVVHFPLPEEMTFPVDNRNGNMAMTLRLHQHFADWPATLTPAEVPAGRLVTATLTISRPLALELLRELPNGAPVFDVEGVYNVDQPNEEVIGGIRKIFRRPVPLHIEDEVPYAESEIIVRPYPPRAGEPTVICTVLSNNSPVTQTVEVHFQIADFGAGVPFMPIGGQVVEIPPYGEVRVCETWIPPRAGHFCVQILLHSDEFGDEKSQRNMDVAEYLQPGVTDRLEFLVGNPTNEPATVTVGIVAHMPDWDIVLDHYELPNLAPGEVVTTGVNTTPAADSFFDVFTEIETPGDMEIPVFDVEVYVDHERVGGFRKVFRPPVPLHRPEDPVFAESEISIEPYPSLDGEPVEICTEVRNQTLREHAATVEFQAAEFGIGLPFHPIGRVPVTLPPLGTENVCIRWSPEHPLFSVRVVIHSPGFPRVWSQRSMDVAEVLRPGVPDAFTFPVRNSLPHTATITLGLDEHLPGWVISVAPDVLPDMAPGEIREATLSVTPGRSLELDDDTPVVDVIAYADNELLGGFRKLYRIPIPLHRPRDPIYAESEISIAPYPLIANEPAEVCVELRNPTSQPQTATLQLSWSEFGIGLPFNPFAVIPDIVIPPRRLQRVCHNWVPREGGQYGIEAILHVQGYQRTLRSTRVVDVHELLYPGANDTLLFPVSVPPNPELGLEAGNLVTVHLGLIPHIPPDWGWELALSADVLTEVEVGGAPKLVELAVSVPPGSPMPPAEHPIADVEARVRGWLVGGLRKAYLPPVPIHDPRDPIYAEREISINPYPAREGEPVEICAEVRNPLRVTQTMAVHFRIAPFGIGRPFTPIAPPIMLDLGPGQIERVCVRWVPPTAGQFGVEVELVFPGHENLEPVISQRVMDVSELLLPNRPSTLQFVVANPSATKAMTIALGLVPHQRHWEMRLEPRVFPGVKPGAHVVATLVVTPHLESGMMPPDEAPVVDVEAYDADTGELIGGFRKLYRPPVPIHQPGDPIYAEREISIEPYPARFGEPVELCVEVRNPTTERQVVLVHFGVAPLGIGLPFRPVASPVEVVVPPEGVSRPCVVWVPRETDELGRQVDQFGVQVEIEVPNLDMPPIRSWRILDVKEVLKVGKISEPYVFPVRNPTDREVTITLGLISHRPEWEVTLNPDVLAAMQPGKVRPVTLTVSIPPSSTLPVDEAPVVDVEAYIDGELIGGFRKIFRPPVPIHHPGDPIYAEREIKVHPYPLHEREPAEICVEVRNPTPEAQTLQVDFRWAEFGIGFPYRLIRTLTVTVEPRSIAEPCTMWVPPHGGRFGFGVELRRPGENEGFKSWRVIDVGEILLPNEESTFIFEVANTKGVPITVTLGAIKHLPQWIVRLQPQTLWLEPGQVEQVTMFVTPVQRPGDPEPQEAAPVLDVEAVWESADNHGLLGGFRKLFFPPAPVHRPEDPIFAEREIMIFPYPPVQDEPARLAMEIRNPTEEAQTMTVTFQVGPFGIGRPFLHTVGVVTATLPPLRRDVVSVPWIPTIPDKFCVRVVVEAPFFNRSFISTRNVDVVRLPRPYGRPEVFPFVVGDFDSIRDERVLTRPLTITLGLKEWLPDWTVELWPPEIVFETRTDVSATARLTITPPLDPADLPRDGGPVADVSGYINGRLIGGIRKVWRPPVPLGHIGEPSYAESEISIDPDPPVAHQPVTFTTEVRNNTADPYTITVEFGWADFGFGIPFSNTNVVPPQTTLMLGAYQTQTVSAEWTPDKGGHYCLQIILTDDQTNERQFSQRNVDVREIRPNQVFTYPFEMCNPLGITMTMDLGLVTEGLPENWSVTMVPTSTELGPYACFTGVVTVTRQGSRRAPAAVAQDEGSQSFKVNVEGYLAESGELVGGIELGVTTLPEQVSASQGGLTAGPCYDIGTTGARVCFNPIGGIHTVTGTVTYNYPVAGASDLVQRYYEIAGNVNSGFSATLILRYEDDELPAGVNEGDLQLYRYLGGGAWEAFNPASVSVDAANNVITAYGITGFSTWAIGTTVPTAIVQHDLLATGSSVRWLGVLAGLAAAGMAMWAYQRRRRQED
jgi:hypothetical protein